MNNFFVDDDDNFENGVYDVVDQTIEYPEASHDDDVDVFLYLSDRELDLPEIQSSDSKEQPGGLSKTKLGNLPSIVLQSSAKEKCTVCIRALRKGQKAIELQCGHLYHKKCILPWLKSNGSCPLCKTQL
ncbi:hypothetical protein P9112_012724 [Eukaryota sp. TZLM1-RC]